MNVSFREPEIHLIVVHNLRNRHLYEANQSTYSYKVYWLFSIKTHTLCFLVRANKLSPDLNG